MPITPGPTAAAYWLFFEQTPAGANPMALSVVVTSLATAATVLAALAWREVY
ncbi:MAG: hypothetical protein QG597_1388 [Actinomycetota bacterium]|nr:hypothetical protein [Actinomycetota bacterium]